MTSVALEQLRLAPGQVEANVDHALDRCAAAFRAGADVVVLPELTTSGYVTDPQVVSRCAEPVDGRSVHRFADVAREHGGLVAVGLCESADGVAFNSVLVLDGDGPVLHYRKLHLFDAERDAYQPGDLGLPVAQTEHGVLGVCICYDLRFVEVLRSLSLRGVDLVLAPAAWVAGFDRSVPAEGLSGQAHSVVVQANLDQVAVVAVSQVSPDGETGPRMLGGSVAVDAFGSLLAGPLSRNAPDSAIAEVDVALGRSARVRGERIRPREDRRVDVYGVRYLEECL